MISVQDIRNRSQKPENRFQGRILSLDPGHTTGWSVWDCNRETIKMVACGQIKTWVDEDLVLDPFHNLVCGYAPNIVVMESYQIYEWKTDDHTWSQVPTVQVIGMIKTICKQNGKPYLSQTAQVAKQFVTDEKLESWGYWKKGERHARDAIRHAVYYILFGKPIK